MSSPEIISSTAMPCFLGYNPSSLPPLAHVPGLELQLPALASLQELAPAQLLGLKNKVGESQGPHRKALT